ncbi:hypothetical protein ACN263_10950 [Micromonospora sp. WMMD729]|uniref:hypothetical protein n=1 Tax=Micromonospora sp. WMMD729 TaxID=3404127 RepID=UPI003BF51F65
MLEAVQLVSPDGRALTITVWTDWTLVVQLWSDVGIPDYLWPPEERSRTPILGFDDSNNVIHAVVPRLDNFGKIASVDFELDSRKIMIKSMGGNLSVGID